jgi:hypothetical protein
MLNLILVLLALIFFALSALGVNEHPRLHFAPAGLFCLTLAWLLRSMPHLG